MFVTAYLDANRVLEESPDLDCQNFALKTLDRMLSEVWTESEGFAHRIGGPALRGSLDDQVFGVIALLDAYEATLDAKYFQAARRTMDITIEKYGDRRGWRLFRSRFRCPGYGWLGRPPQTIPRLPNAQRQFRGSDGAHPNARLHRRFQISGWARKTLEAFAGVASQYGLFAATYGLAATLFAFHPTQVVITGPAGDAGADKLEQAANRVFRFGKAALRIRPDASLINLPVALRQTLPHLPKDKAQALVCSGTTCLPPTSDPEELTRILQKGIAGTAAG